MTVYGMDLLDDLLRRIHEGQIDVTGEDVGPFRRLLEMGLVEFNGQSAPDEYRQVLPTQAGTERVLFPNGEGRE
jgi:hypothetical protein